MGHAQRRAMRVKPTTTPQVRPAVIPAAPPRPGGAIALKIAEGRAPAFEGAQTVKGPTALDGAARTPRRVGPEQPGQVGDVVQASPITASVGEVLAAQRALDALVAKDPHALATLRAAPYPRSASAQLTWALARPSGLPNLQNPVWTTATNDSRAALVAWAQGVVTAQAHGLPMTDQLEAQALAQLNNPLLADPAALTALQGQPFPSTASIDSQLQWAVAMTYAWDWTSNPNVTANPTAQALVSFVNGAIAKASDANAPVVLTSARHTMKVDGDTRVFALHTPPGTPPKEGWPTVVFFHGSFGGHAPEQNEEYQQLNAYADAHGFQVAYPVGLPQDRADSQTGRGMLNWDPVGAGPGGANDRFVHALIDSLTHASGATHADRTRIFAAGHSQGGFYTSDLVAAYPDVFAGAAILGAGLGSVADAADLSKSKRHTPLMLRVGTDDLHIGVGERLAARFESAGFGDQFRFDRLPNRGHEVLGGDLEAMLAFIESQPKFTATKAGTLDGKTGEAQPRPPVFRDALSLDALPAGLSANPTLVRALTALAQNPYLNTDQNQRTLTSQEWRLALQYESTFPPAMQQAIEALRGFYVVAPPPGGPLIDLNHIPAAIHANQQAMAALAVLVKNPMIDLDGYPGLFTAEEAATAFDFKATLDPQMQAGVDALRTYFFGALPTGPDLRERASQTLSGGARLQSYPGSEAAVAAMKQMVAGLSRDPAFAALLKKTTLVISPPGRGLDAIPEADGLGDGVEGAASSVGFTGNGRSLPPPAFVIREDSIRRWQLGAGHELLHLLRSEKGPALEAEMNQVWQQIGGQDGQPDGYPNAEEMFAYLGQWYLAGFGEQLKQVSPEAYALIAKTVGTARIDPGGLTANDALPSLQSLMTWFRSGQHERV